MRQLLLGPLVALRFLSAVPVVPSRVLTPEAFPRAIGFFPLVGAAIGVAGALADTALGRVLDPLVAAVLAIALVAVLSGGLHLDGLADSADGLFGSASREERLAIMREGGIGAFGAAAVALVLLLECAALSSARSPGTALVAAAVGSRWAMAASLWAFPQARADGLGHVFVRGLRVWDLVLATLVAGVLLWVASGPGAPALLLVSCIVVSAVGALAVRRLGGVTGDINGAIGELTFAALLVARGAVA